MAVGDVYNKKLLELAANISHIGSLDEPAGTATAHSRLCGSKVKVDVEIDQHQCVSAFAHDVKACALGQASSAIMAKGVLGASLSDLCDIRDGMYAMLKEGAEAPVDVGGGRWRDVEALSPVRDFKARHASTLLTFDATVEAVEKAIAAKQQGAA